MKELVQSFKDSNNALADTKVLSGSESYIESEQINASHLFDSDGDATIMLKVDEANFTLSVTVAFLINGIIGYGPWQNLLDESSTRVKTFDSTKKFVASLYNQSYFIKNHMGFKYRVTRDSGSGDCTVKSGVVVS